MVRRLILSPCFSSRFRHLFILRSAKKYKIINNTQCKVVWMKLSVLCGNKRNLANRFGATPMFEHFGDKCFKSLESRAHRALLPGYGVYLRNASVEPYETTVVFYVWSRLDQHWRSLKTRTIDFNSNSTPPYMDDQLNAELSRVQCTVSAPYAKHSVLFLPINALVNELSYGKIYGTMREKTFKFNCTA